ncbi:hypothetical protein [Metasolibacillus meyeri]|nr:hypothetical protein [Metasolibacillus meyeri]
MTKQHNPVGLSYIHQQTEKVNQKEKFYFDKEQDEFILYYPTFSQNKKDELFVELVETINYYEQNNAPFISNDFELIRYTEFLIFKHFSSLKDELDGKSYEIHKETADKIYTTGLHKIFKELVFNDDEINKVIEQLYSISELAEKMLVELDK